MNWKKRNEKPEGDKNYLVCWQMADERYSLPHRAYYCEFEERFYSLENNNSHPVVVDIWCEMPRAPE